MNHPGQSTVIVLYDGDCGFCNVMLALLLKWDRAHQLGAVPIGSARGAQLLSGMSSEERLKSWHLVDDAGVVHSAGGAIPVILTVLPGGTPLARIAARFPHTTSRAYNWVAAHRVLLGRLLRGRSRARAARVIAESAAAEPISVRGGCGGALEH